MTVDDCVVQKILEPRIHDSLVPKTKDVVVMLVN